jgi:C-terminal processing protease CtpA/Prc
MKTKIKFLVAMMLLPLFALAQEGQGPGGGGQRMTPEQRAQAEAKRMKEQLVLTDSQAVKYEKIALKYNSLRREAMQNREDTAAMRKKMTEVEAQQSEDVKAILSAEQYAKYQQIVSERRNRMGGRGSRPSGPPPSDK